MVDRNTFNKNIAVAPCFATALALSVTSVIAPTELHAQETLELYPVSIGVPSGFGASSGMLFGWVDYTNFDPYTGIEGDDDGSMGLGFGLGDPAETIGLEVSVSITSVSTGWWGDGVFGDEGSLNLKVHRYVPGLAFASYASLSFGLDNIVGWGDETEEYPVNAYVAYSQVSDIQLGNQLLPLDITVGYGSATADFGTEPGAFASLGLGLTPSLSAALSRYGDEMNVGIVIFPQSFDFASVGLSYAWDPEQHSDTARFIISLSFLLQP